MTILKLFLSSLASLLSWEFGHYVNIAAWKFAAMDILEVRLFGALFFAGLAGFTLWSAYARNRS